MFEASIEPSPVAPAPTRLCISSIYTMAFPSCAAPSIIILMRFSKSPRNCVPATSVPRSNRYIRLPFRRSGTRPSFISRASPYTSAVLPTPGSPTCSGLFFSLRHNTCIVRSSSRWRPISGLRPSICSFRHITRLRQSLPAVSAFSSFCFPAGFSLRSESFRVVSCSLWCCGGMPSGCPVPFSPAFS